MAAFNTWWRHLSGGCHYPFAMSRHRTRCAASRHCSRGGARETKLASNHSRSGFPGVRELRALARRESRLHDDLDRCWIHRRSGSRRHSLVLLQDPKRSQVGRSGPRPFSGSCLGRRGATRCCSPDQRSIQPTVAAELELERGTSAHDERCATCGTAGPLRRPAQWVRVMFGPDTRSLESRGSLPRIEVMVA